jgi:hypothetical protein
MSRDFPEGRADQYALCGEAMALIARNLGAPLDDGTAMGWIDTTRRLAAADDLSETSEQLPDSRELLTFLELSAENPRLLATARRLIISTRQEQDARTLPVYFGMRAWQAVEMTNLLRYQSPEAVYRDNSLWDELGKLTVVATHLDTFMDCREDAKAHAAQFTAFQLAKGALRQALITGLQLKPATRSAAFSALHAVGVDAQLARRIWAKPLMSGESYKKWVVNRRFFATFKNDA